MNWLEGNGRIWGNVEGPNEARTHKFKCYTFAPLGNFLQRHQSWGRHKKDSWIFAGVTLSQTKAVEAQVVICKRLSEMMESESKTTRVGLMERGKVYKKVEDWKFI